MSGEGARLNGGRWNSQGVSLVYVASSIPLAMLETLVHIHSSALLKKYVVIPVEFDSKLVREVDRKKLPTDWDASPVAPDVQAVGDDWVASGASAVLKVPSAVVDSEFNYLLNLHHPDFSKIKIGKSEPIRFDPRLK